MTHPYSADPLTDDQRAEVLRVMSETAALERHNCRVMLDGELAAARRRAKDYPDAAELHQAAAAAFERALDLLYACWPTPDLGPDVRAA